MTHIHKSCILNHDVACCICQPHGCHLTKNEETSPNKVYQRPQELAFPPDLPTTPSPDQKDCSVCSENRNLPMEEKKLHFHEDEWAKINGSVGDNVQPKDWKKRFDEKRNAIHHARFYGANEDSEVVEFGYKTIRPSADGASTEVFTVTDWGNIKSFISDLLVEEKKEWEHNLLYHINKNVERPDSLISALGLTHNI